MSREFVRAPLCLVAIALLTACGQGQRTERASSEEGSKRESSNDAANALSTAATVSGVASYRERMALPADATFEATLQDVSRADAPADVIAQTRLDPAGQPPFRFEIKYDPARLQAGHTYALRARVTRAGQLLFTTDKHYPLPPEGQQADLMLVRAQQQQSGTASTATLENTYWKLMRLGKEPVVASAQQREPHLVLHSEGNRVAGFGGCNRMTGSYSTSGEKLTFSQMAGTMMACPDGMQYERAFHDALGKVAKWRIDGETMELFDEAGTSVAQFESRYMR